MTDMDDFDQDDLADFFENDNDGSGMLTPEQVFKLVTIIPSRGLKIKAYLVDKDGERIETSQVATDLVDYVNKEMAKPENNNINTQVFPLIGQLMISYVPRAVGLDYANVLFAAPQLRNTLIHMGMAAFLMLQYIKQHGLKIVTEEEEITEQELTAMRRKESETQDALDKAIRSIMGRGEPGDDD